jgi:hypothetical protein
LGTYDEWRCQATLKKEAWLQSDFSAYEDIQQVDGEESGIHTLVEEKLSIKHIRLQGSSLSRKHQGA